MNPFCYGQSTHRYRQLPEEQCLCTHGSCVATVLEQGDNTQLFLLCRAGGKEQLTSGTAGLTKACASKIKTLILN